MDIQEKSGNISLNSDHMFDNGMCVDVRMPSPNGLQLKDFGSSGDKHSPKVRKTYTITKQRERWTEEEHNKFLEALKLYGRAWRHIEEHVGSKTAVQIRSHAQKFFSKVVRESASNSTGTVKSIEIPPPRPKRKPIHPYPRKLGNSSSIGIPDLEQQPEGSLSLIPSLSEQENGSPTSVLSAFGSEMTVSNLPNSCTSPVSSAAGSNPVGMLLDQQENGQSTPASVEKENRSPSPGLATDGLASQYKSTMDLDLGSENHIPSKEGSLIETQATSLRLFGRTVLVTDSHKPSSDVVGNMMQFCKSLPTTDIEIHHGSTDMDMDLQTTAQQGDSLESPCKNTLNLWPGGVRPMLYCLPFHGDLMSSAESVVVPVPWWALCGSLPYPVIHSQSISPKQDHPHSCAEASDDKERQKEGSSWSGSNTASVCETGLVEKNSVIIVVDSQSAEHSKHKEPEPISSLKPSENSAFRSLKPGSDKSTRGFMPYKRCVVERELPHSQMVIGEDGEGQRIRLCM